MKKVFPLIILIFSLLLLIYTGYKSFLVFEGENKTYYFSYILISFTGVFVSILVFLINVEGYEKVSEIIYNKTH